jgi:hypothetical protein
MSDWYRALFPNVRLAKDTETECVTTMGGSRFALAVGGFLHRSWRRRHHHR